MSLNVMCNVSFNAGYREWLKGIPGNRLHYEAIVLPERLLKLGENDVSSVEVFLAGVLPTSVTGRVIFINNDVIVQGKYSELASVYNFITLL